VLLTTLIAAAEAAEEESSKTPFYVMGTVLAAFAVIIAAIGIRRHETFPPSRSAARGVMGLAAVLVLLTMGAAVITA
jgi:hypothetical protein